MFMVLVDIMTNFEERFCNEQEDHIIRIYIKISKKLNLTTKHLSFGFSVVSRWNEFYRNEIEITLLTNII